MHTCNACIYACAHLFSEQIQQAGLGPVVAAAVQGVVVKDASKGVHDVVEVRAPVADARLMHGHDLGGQPAGGAEGVEVGDALCEHRVLLHLCLQPCFDLWCTAFITTVSFKRA